MAWNPTDWEINIPDIVSIDEFNAFIRPSNKTPMDLRNEMITFALRQATQYLNTFCNNEIFETLDKLDKNSQRDKTRVLHLKTAIMYVAEYFITTARVFASLNQSISGSTPFMISRDSFASIVEQERPDIVNELNAGGWISTFYAKPVNNSFSCGNYDGELVNWIQKYLNDNYLPRYTAEKHPMMSDIDLNHHKIINGDILTYDEDLRQVNVDIGEGVLIPTLKDFIPPSHWKLAATKYVDNLINQIQNIRVADFGKEIQLKNLINDIKSLTTKQYTNAYIEEAIAEARINTFNYKGTLQNVSDLPATNNRIGDVYFISDNSLFYAWDGTKWDLISGNISGISDIAQGQDILIDKTDPQNPTISVDRTYQNNTFANKSSDFVSPITDINKGITQANILNVDSLVQEWTTNLDIIKYSDCISLSQAETHYLKVYCLDDGDNNARFNDAFELSLQTNTDGTFHHINQVGGILHEQNGYDSNNQWVSYQQGVGFNQNICGFLDGSMFDGYNSLIQIYRKNAASTEQPTIRKPWKIQLWKRATI